MRPYFDIENYDELLQYLINSKDELKRDQNKMLSKQISFGYFLELFCQLHDYEYICGRKNTRQGDLISDYF